MDMMVQVVYKEIMATIDRMDMTCPKLITIENKISFTAEEGKSEILLKIQDKNEENVFFVPANVLKGGVASGCADAIVLILRKIKNTRGKVVTIERQNGELIIVKGKWTFTIQDYSVDEIKPH